MIKILDYTKNPLTTIGGYAGLCYGSTNESRFKNIAKRCLEEGHGRISEYADVTLELSEVSAKMVREWYTHIHTTKIQESTRYIDYSNKFKFVTPKSISKDEESNKIWECTMQEIQNSMNELKELGVPVEDFTNLLPLAYKTKTVTKINLRSLIHMFNVRSCTCAYHEYREVMMELKQKLYKLDDEWKFIADNYFVPKCIPVGFCQEKTRNCGIRPLKGEPQLYIVYSNTNVVKGIFTLKTLRETLEIDDEMLKFDTFKINDITIKKFVPEKELKL